MAPIIIYVHYNGEITNSHEGIQYQGEHAKTKIIRLKHRISKLSKLKKQICKTLELDHHLHVMTITYQHPHIILNNVAQFVPVLITSDDDVNIMTTSTSGSGRGATRYSIQPSLSCKI
jgi:hypothetical protein